MHQAPPTRIITETVETSVSPAAREQLSSLGYDNPSINIEGISQTLRTLLAKPDDHPKYAADESFLSFKLIDRSEQNRQMAGDFFSTQADGWARLTNITPQMISAEVAVVATDTGRLVRSEEGLNKVSLHELQHVHDMFHCYYSLVKNDEATARRLAKRTRGLYRIGIPLYLAALTALNNPADMLLDSPMMTTSANTAIAGLGTILALKIGRDHIEDHIKHRAYKASETEARANNTEKHFRDFPQIINLGRLSVSNN